MQLEGEFVGQSLGIRLSGLAFRLIRMLSIEEIACRKRNIYIISMAYTKAGESTMSGNLAPQLKIQTKQTRILSHCSY